MEEGNKPRCIICSRSSGEYIVVRGYAICAQCEQRLITLRVVHPHYRFYIEQLKKIWQTV